LLLLDIESNKKLREEFAKICFETLLQFSFVSQSPGGVSSGSAVRNQSSGGSSSSSLSTSTEEGTITHLAIESLLNRCKNVLQTFVADERLSGKCPLPRLVATALCLSNELIQFTVMSRFNSQS